MDSFINVAMEKNKDLECVKEIGGYIEFEKYHGKMLHSDGIKMNCGRNCLAYLILAREIRKLVLPYYMCCSVLELCQRYGVETRFYHIDSFFRPENIELADDEWLYFMNFYGQMCQLEIEEYVYKYQRIIVDFTHDYFHGPIKGTDTLYTCRKFFGVSDGAILYTDVKHPEIEIETDESFERLHYLLGRFERPASEFYDEAVKNNGRFRCAPIRKMSKLTENLLHGIDYQWVKERRTDNYAYLNIHLKGINQLKVKDIEGAFAYPFMVSDGERVKKELAASKIFIPTLWPNVLDSMPEDTVEFQMAKNILPLPCDQRYTESDMKRMINCIFSIMNINEGGMPCCQ